MFKIIIFIGIIFSFNLYADIDLINDEIKSGTEILASDMNYMFEKVEVALSNNPNLTNIIFDDYQAEVDEISKLKENIGILTKLYTITELYPPTLPALTSTVLDNYLSSDIISSELNNLFSKVISDINNYTGSTSGSSGKSLLATGVNYGCAIQNEKIYCWGQNSSENLGINGSNKSFLNKKVEVPLSPDAGKPLNIVIGSSSFGGNCVETDAGKIYCWGTNNYGETGNGLAGDVISPYEASNTFYNILSSGATIVKMEHSGGGSLNRGLRCIQTSDQKLYCIGYSVGIGLMGVSFPSLTRVTRHDGSELLIKDFGLGSTHMCVIDINDKTLCFGGNSNGQLGDPDLQTTFYQVFYTQEWIEPKTSSGTTFSFKKISLGENGTCGVDLNDDLYCWGYYANGTGITVTAASELHPKEPTKVNLQNYNFKVEKIEIGNNFYCIFGDDKKIYCWGSNIYGQLGRHNQQFTDDYTTSVDSIFEPVGLYNFWDNYTPSPTWADISLGRYHVCGITNYGDVHCWGRNDYGQLGMHFNSSDILTIQERPMPTYPVVESFGEYYGP